MTTPIDLRPYQARAIAECRARYAAGARAVALVSPTGSGKTIMGAAACRSHSARGGSSVWVTHRHELSTQAEAKLDGAARVVSIQGLLVGERPSATMVVFDEFHHLAGTAWRTVVDHYREAFVLGLSATPDGRGLADVFGGLVVAARTSELLAAGHLVRMDVVGPARRCTALAADPADAYRRHAGDRPGIVFCATVDQAREVAQALGGECIDGEMPTAERDAAIARYRAGETRVLTGCTILTEGFDAPHTEVVVLARKCGSQALFLQCVGRAMRPAPGKAGALLIDLVGAVHEHGMPSDDREYSLGDSPIRQAETLPPITQCRGCGAVFRAGPRACVRCGQAAPPAPRPKLSPAELSRIAAATPLDRRRQDFDDWRRFAARRGYKPGWAAMRYRTKYGAWPAFGKAAA